MLKFVKNCLCSFTQLTIMFFFIHYGIMSNCISNVINTPNQQNYNPAALNLFKKDSKAESRFIQVPNSLYKYSLNKTLEEQDEFKKSVRYEHYTKTRKKSSLLKKIYSLWD